MYEQIVVIAVTAITSSGTTAIATGWLIPWWKRRQGIVAAEGDQWQFYTREIEWLKKEVLELRRGQLSHRALYWSVTEEPMSIAARIFKRADQYVRSVGRGGHGAWPVEGRR